MFRQVKSNYIVRECIVSARFSNAEYKAACTAYVQWTHLCSGQRPAWPRPPGGDKRTAWARTRCRMSVRHYRKPARTVCRMDKTTDKRSAGHRSPNIGRQNSIPARCKTLVSAVSCPLQAHWTNPLNRSMRIIGPRVIAVIYTRWFWKWQDMFLGSEGNLETGKRRVSFFFFFFFASIIDKRVGSVLRIIPE